MIRKCVICRKFEGLPFKAPQPPPVPECRVKEAPAFNYTGVDFAGLLVICTSRSSQSNRVWMTLFTCYITRAVHLDAVPDETTAAFIRCLKRFVAWRGLSRWFISDNGKTAKYLDAVLRMEQYKNTTQDLELPGNSTWSKLRGGEMHLREW